MRPQPCGVASEASRGCVRSDHWAAEEGGEQWRSTRPFADFEEPRYTGLYPQ